MNVFLFQLLFAVIGIGIAYGFGLWLKERVSFGTTLILTIGVGRIILTITDAVVGIITKS